MRLLRKITYGEFSEFVQEKKVHIAVTVWPTTVHIFMAYGYYTINGSSHREIEIDFEVEQALVIY